MVFIAFSVLSVSLWITFPISPPWRRGLVRIAPCWATFYVQLSLEDFVATRRIKCVELFAAEGEGGDFAVGCRQDAVDSPGLVAHLHAEARRDVQPAVDVDAHSISAGII